MATSNWQQTFNAIKAIDPAAAWAYAYNASGARPSEILSLQLGMGMTDAQINQLANNYARGARQSANGPAIWQNFVAANPQFANAPRSYRLPEGMDPARFRAQGGGVFGMGGQRSPTPTPTGTGSTPQAGGVSNYGLSQVLGGFGIPGFENGPMVAGPYSSWAGTAWNPAQRGNWVAAPINPSPTNGGNVGFSADVGGAPGINQNAWYPQQYANTGSPTGSAWNAEQNPILAQQMAQQSALLSAPTLAAPTTNRGTRRTIQSDDPAQTENQPVINEDGTVGTPTATTTTEPGTATQFQIRPATPYQTTWYQSTYGGTPTGGLRSAPWANIHEQMGAAMQGIAPAYPGFQWASPQALAALGGYGLPGGWTGMLGFTPGGA